MGLLGRTVGTLKEVAFVDKQARENEKDYVKNNLGSKAVCEYFAALFEKGHDGYVWLKENKVPLFPVVYKDCVCLCATQYEKDKMPKEVQVQRYSFEEIFSWYDADEELSLILTTQTARNELQGMINQAVTALPHIKYNGGYLVRMFQ